MWIELPISDTGIWIRFLVPRRRRRKAVVSQHVSLGLARGADGVALKNAHLSSGLAEGWKRIACRVFR